MQNFYATLTTSLHPPSVRPEIEIHSLDYDFPEHTVRPLVRAGHDTGCQPSRPGEPACVQHAATTPNATSLPSYKSPPPLSVRPGQQNIVIKKTAMPLTAKPDASTFIRAVRNGSHASVMQHIAARLPINEGPAKDAPNPLMQAASEGHEDIVRLLLKSGADVGRSLPNGMTALLFAAREGHTAIVRLLLSRGAKVDTAQKDGVTALMFAAQNGHVEIVELLLSKGAAVNAVQKNDMTALLFATQYGFATVREVLLRWGALDLNS